jgi:succinate dehydrogenase / fumarate reductase flavoprotein subunit/fumarate reductase (CoM/CoB) subunit A
MSETPPRTAIGYDSARLDWFDLRNMLLVAEAVARSALARRESRGAHQREDYPLSDEDWCINQSLRLKDSHLALASLPVTQGLTGETSP